MIKIYTDGSCIGNPGQGGWAALILDEGKKTEIKGNKKNTTNMIYYLALCRLQLIFIIWPYLINNHIAYLKFIKGNRKIRSNLGKIFFGVNFLRNLFILTY